VSHVAALLEQEGGREYTQTRADELTQRSLAALEQANPLGETGELLRTLALNLLDRRA
jgi:geranylgeranyl pyrophosphate synthase